MDLECKISRKTDPKNRKSMKFLTLVPEFLKSQNSWYKQEITKESLPPKTTISSIHRQIGLFSLHSVHNKKYLPIINKGSSSQMKLHNVGVVRTNNEIIEV